MPRSTTMPSATTSPFPQLPGALAREGIDYATYRENMRKEITLVLLRRARSALAHQCHAARAGPVHRAHEEAAGRERRIQHLAHPHRGARRRQPGSRSDELAKKAEEVYERAKTEDFGPPRHRVLQQPDRTGRRRAGPAQGTRAADAAGRDHRGAGGRRGFQAAVRAQWLPHHEAQRRCAAQPATPSRTRPHARHILDAPEHLAGRRHRAPETRRHPREGARGRGFRGICLQHVGGFGLRRARAAILAGAAPADFVPEFEAELAS